MKTSSFEVNFLKSLNDHIEKTHPSLEVLRASNTNQAFLSWKSRTSSSYTPDLVVRDRNTGKMLVVEVKGGRPLSSVPFASVSKLKLFAGSAPEGKVKVQLVSSAKIPPSLKSLLEQSKIGVTNTDSTEKAISEMESLLSGLELPD